MSHLKLTSWAFVMAALILPMFNAAPAAAQVKPLDPDHSAWTQILKRRVKAGVVDYAGLKAADSNALNAYLDALGNISRKTYSKWGREAKLAFWINVYNAFTVKLILDNYPLKSIRSIGFLPSAAFRKSFIELPGLRREPYSLNEVENDILRKEFQETRIHFAIVCASKSCPILRDEAYRPADLEKQLDDAARGFLADTSKNRLDGGILRLSSIFKWFAEDFKNSAGSVQGYVAPYLGLDSGRRYEIEYLDYDWSLNGR